VRAFVPSYDAVAPPTVADALRLLAAEPTVWTPLAGGTDLMVLFEAGRLPPGRFLSLWHLHELRGITVSADAVRIGALTTYADIRDHAVIAAELPLLATAARETGALAIQNRGTLGGNIANASPAADSPPGLIAYDAEVTLASASGERTVRYRDFHLGYKQTVRRPDELITAVTVRRHPREAGWVHHFHKVGTRKSQAISKACFAGAARLGDGFVHEARIGLGSVGPTVLAARHAEAVLAGARLDDAALGARVAEALAADVAPIDDIRSTARYRVQVTKNLGAAFVRALVEAARA